MCAISMVFDYGRGMWPYPQIMPQTIPIPTYPQPSVVERVPTLEEWESFLELVEKARKFDEIASQPDCEDPEKATWFKAMEDRMKVMEEKLKTRY